MAQTLVRKVMLKIAADDGDTETKLDRISSKADELARKHPELTPKVNIAAASAKLAVLKRELKDTDDQSVTLKSRFGSLGQALNSGLLGGVSANVGEMTMLQKVMMGLNIATGLGEPLLAGLTVSVMGLAGGVLSAGAGLGVFGVVAKSTLTAAATAATAVQTAQIAYNSAIATGTKRSAAYAAEQKAILTAYAQLSPAQIQLSKNIGSAQNTWQSFVQSNTAGVSKIMSQGIGLMPDVLRAMQPFLGPTEAGLSRIMGSLKTVLDPGQKISSSMLRHLNGAQLPGLSPAAATVQGTLKAMAAQSGTDLEKIAKALGNVVVGILGVVRSFLPMSGSVLTGLDKMTGKFATWGETLSGHSGFQSLMTMFKQDTPVVVGLLKNLAGIVKTVIGEMTGMNTASNSRTLLQVAEAVSGLVNSLLKAHPGLVELALYMQMAGDTGKKLFGTVKGISAAVTGLSDGKKALGSFAAGFSDSKKAADEATGAWGTWGGKASSTLGGIKSLAQQAAVKLGLLKATTVEATAATEGEEGAQEGLNTVMSLNPIGLIVIAIGLLVIAFYELWKHSAAFRDFWKDALKDIVKAGVATWHFIDDDMIHPLMSGVDKTVTFVKSHWKLLAVILATMLLGPIGGLVAFVATHWAQISRLTSRLTGDVTGFFRSLPGRIMGAISALPGMMLSAGENIVSMLARGIENMAMAPVHAISGIISDVRNFLPFSPAKRGPLSGAGSPDIAGRKVGLMLADGMRSAAPAVSASSAHLTRAAGIGAAGRPGYGGGPGGGQPQRIEFRITGGSREFRTWFKKNMRITGADTIVVGA